MKLLLYPAPRCLLKGCKGGFTPRNESCGGGGAGACPPMPVEDDYIQLEDGTRLKVFKRNEEPEPVEQFPKSPMDMVSKETPKEGKQLREIVQKFLKGFGGNGNGELQVCPKPKTELEELNQWLLEPALRGEAINRARRSPNYKYCYELDQIIAPEEF